MPLKATTNVIQYSRYPIKITRYSPRFVFVNISRASHACRLHAHPPQIDQSESKSWLITRIIGDLLNVTDVVADVSVAKKKRAWTQLPRNGMPFSPASGGSPPLIEREPLRRPSRLVGRYILNKHVGRRYPTGRAYHFIASPLHFANLLHVEREGGIRKVTFTVLFTGKNLRMQILLLLFSRKSF